MILVYHECMNNIKSGYINKRSEDRKKLIAASLLNWGSQFNFFCLLSGIYTKILKANNHMYPLKHRALLNSVNRIHSKIFRQNVICSSVATVPPITNNLALILAVYVGFMGRCSQPVALLSWDKRMSIHWLWNFTMLFQKIYCPNCHDTDIVKHGKSPEGKKRYKCRKTPCNAQMFILDWMVLS